MASDGDDAPPSAMEVHEAEMRYRERVFNRLNEGVVWAGELCVSLDAKRGKRGQGREVFSEHAPNRHRSFSVSRMAVLGEMYTYDAIMHIILTYSLIAI